MLSSNVLDREPDALPLCHQGHDMCNSFNNIAVAEKLGVMFTSPYMIGEAMWLE